MWSVWRKQAELYLGHGISMLKLPEKTAQLLEYEAGRPASDVLHVLAATSGTKELLPSLALRVTLGAGHAPAVGFALPAGLKGPGDVQAIAMSASAQALQCDIANVQASVDWSSAGIASASGAALIAELRSWAKEHGAGAVSIEPLWSVATRSTAVQSIRTRACVIHEPGAVTLLAPEAPMHSFSRLVDQSEDERQIVTRWATGLGLEETAITSFRFHTQPKGAWTHGPRAWQGHWSLL